MADEQSILTECVSQVNTTLARVLAPDLGEPLYQDWKVWVGLCAVVFGMIVLKYCSRDARDIGKIVYLVGMDFLVLAIIPFSKMFSTLLILIITFDVFQYIVLFISSVFPSGRDVTNGAVGPSTVAMPPVSKPGNTMVSVPMTVGPVPVEEGYVTVQMPVRTVPVEEGFVPMPVGPVPVEERTLSYTPNTIYTDFDRSCTRVWFVFIAQCIFLLGYLDSLITIIKTLPANSFSGMNYAY